MFVCFIVFYCLGEEEKSADKLTCRVSEKNCAQMLRAEGARRLCSRLTDTDPSGQLLFRSVDVLWNLLEYGDKQVVAEQLNNITCIK